MKGLSLLGHEKVPHGFGLTGEHGSDTADVLELRGCLNQGLLLLFLRYGTLDWAEGRRKDCAFMGILKDFSIFNEDIKS